MPRSGNSVIEKRKKDANYMSRYRAKKRAERESSSVSSSTFTYDNRSDSMSDISQSSQSSHTSHTYSSVETLMERNKKLEKENNEFKRMIMEQNEKHQQERMEQNEKHQQQMMALVGMLSKTVENTAIGVSANQQPAFISTRAAANAAPKEAKPLNKTEEYTDKMTARLEKMADKTINIDEFIEKYVYMDDEDRKSYKSKNISRVDLYKNIIKRAVKSCNADDIYLPIQCSNIKDKKFYIRENDEWVDHQDDMDDDKAASISAIITKLNSEVSDILIEMHDIEMNEFWDKYGLKDENGEFVRPTYVKLKPPLTTVDKLPSDLYEEFQTDHDKFYRKYGVVKEGGYAAYGEFERIAAGDPEYNPLTKSQAVYDIRNNITLKYKDLILTTTDNLMKFANTILPYFKFQK